MVFRWFAVVYELPLSGLYHVHPLLKDKDYMWENLVWANRPWFLEEFSSWLWLSLKKVVSQLALSSLTADRDLPLYAAVRWLFRYPDSVQAREGSEHNDKNWVLISYSVRNHFGQLSGINDFRDLSVAGAMLQFSRVVGVFLGITSRCATLTVVQPTLIVLYRILQGCLPKHRHCIAHGCRECCIHQKYF